MLRRDLKKLVKSLALTSVILHGKGHEVYADVSAEEAEVLMAALPKSYGYSWGCRTMWTVHPVASPTQELSMELDVNNVAHPMHY